MRIVLENVSKSFGIISALKDISFSIESGEFVVICGPSGSGKSTLIKLLLHQLKPTSGKITLGDTCLNTAKKYQIEATRRRIGVVFQDYQLIPDKTVEENVYLAMEIASFSKNVILPKIDEVLRRTGLASRRSLFPSQLSGGERQRASLARALAVEPKIILADEPTGNLDPENAWNLLKLLKEINQLNQTTVIVTTHDQDIIESLGKRTLYLNKGQLVKETSPLKKHAHA